MRERYFIFFLFFKLFPVLSTGVLLPEFYDLGSAKFILWMKQLKKSKIFMFYFDVIFKTCFNVADVGQTLRPISRRQKKRPLF